MLVLFLVAETENKLFTHCSVYGFDALPGWENYCKLTLSFELKDENFNIKLRF